MRTALIAGNWKMNTIPSEALALVKELRMRLSAPKVDVLVCPPFVSLATVADALDGSAIAWGHKICTGKKAEPIRAR